MSKKKIPQSKTIFISTADYNKMIDHCRSCYPNEACGILGGNDGFVLSCYPVKNTDQSPASYNLDPLEMLQTLKEMETKEEEMLAVFHSHPASEAFPSSTDVERAIDPALVYVIVSLQENEPQVKGFLIDTDSIVSIDINIVKER